MLFLMKLLFGFCLDFLLPKFLDNTGIQITKSNTDPAWVHSKETLDPAWVHSKETLDPAWVHSKEALDHHKFTAKNLGIA